MCYVITFNWTGVQLLGSSIFTHSNMYFCEIFKPPKIHPRYLLNVCSINPPYTHSAYWMLALTFYPKNTYSISWILNVEGNFKLVGVPLKTACPCYIEPYPQLNELVWWVYGYIPIVEYVLFNPSYSHIRIKECVVNVAKRLSTVANRRLSVREKCTY